MKGSILITILWLFASPLKSGCSGHFTELLFQLVPLEVLSLLVFAQWHFVPAALLVILLAAAELGLLWYVVREERKHPLPRKRRRNYSVIF